MHLVESVRASMSISVEVKVDGVDASSSVRVDGVDIYGVGLIT